MQKIENISLKIAILLLMAFSKLQLWAQDDDDDSFIPSSGGSSDLSGMEGMMDYTPVRFGTSDVIMVVLLLVACYVFGKIWKGCSYLILAFAALMYYLIKY